MMQICHHYGVEEKQCYMALQQTPLLDESHAQRAQHK
jgi:hypothetical protein